MHLCPNCRAVIVKLLFWPIFSGQLFTFQMRKLIRDPTLPPRLPGGLPDGHLAFVIGSAVVFLPLLCLPSRKKGLEKGPVTSSCELLFFHANIRVATWLSDTVLA
jgi:hypothetical protein